MAADASPIRVDLAKEADFLLGRLRVRPSIRQVETGSASETLEPRIMQVLVALHRRRGEVVSRDDLIEACWEGRIVSDGAIHRSVSLVRKLGEAHDAFQLETIPRVGYRMALGAKPPASPAEHPGERGEAPTLAVLPFTNRSDLPEDEVFAAGMVEDVIAALSQGVNVRVLASAATAHLGKGAPVDFAAIGLQLGVRYLIEGNVRRAGAGLRISVQLIEAATGAVLWTARYERELDELSARQDGLVAEFAAALDVQVQNLIARTPKEPGNLTAWEAVMHSNAAFREVDGPGIRHAVEEAERALAIAPDYAAAHAQLATARALHYMMDSPDDPDELQRIQVLIDRALALEPDDVFVLTSVANAYGMSGRPREALYQLARARRKSPDAARVQYSLGFICCLLNRNEEALEHLEAAERVMPGAFLLYLVKWWQAVTYVRMGRWDEADAALDEEFALNPSHDPGHILKAITCHRAQRHTEAMEQVAALRGRGLQLEQARRIMLRCFINSAAADGIAANVEALWSGMSTAP